MVRSSVWPIPLMCFPLSNNLWSSIPVLITNLLSQSQKASFSQCIRCCCFDQIFGKLKAEILIWQNKKTKKTGTLKKWFRWFHTNSDKKVTCICKHNTHIAVIRLEQRRLNFLGEILMLLLSYLGITPTFNLWKIESQLLIASLSNWWFFFDDVK